MVGRASVAERVFFARPRPAAAANAEEDKGRAIWSRLSTLIRQLVKRGKRLSADLKKPVGARIVDWRRAGDGGDEKTRAEAEKGGKKRKRSDR